MPRNRKKTGPGKAATQFKPGKSGNPKGRPPTPPEVRAAARLLSLKCIAVQEKLLKSKSEKMRLEAAERLLNRGIGHPPQSVAGADGEPTTSPDEARSKLADALACLAAARTTPGDPGKPQ